ncbi:response regulator transcription factor [Halomonas campisalis]|uniref:Response regulator transcription factor n=1 Tax=Billgrantia campisalis TaxID=74661 RepID=A0ABS9P8U4_9GAMM|nr:response regulator transcription factor [Halomonas campisalis]MCG6658193.1 response regulator transcription factor [Halomonas campisalis]MDR5862861.1 response regulator transcription factor [Halomonas campisalis]
MYKLLIADDHPLFREAIVRVIRDAFQEAEIFETEDLDATLTLAQQHEDIDLILLDLNMPGVHGLSGLIQLRTEAPTIPVVIISAEEEKQVILQAVTYGAVGFITKSSPREQMTKAIAQILDGNIYLPSDIIRASDTTKRSGSRNEHAITSQQLETLTRKQLQVLEHMTRGESNKMIAYNLNIAETTVKAHVSAILRKLGVHSRVQAILSTSDIDFNVHFKRVPRSGD